MKKSQRFSWLIRTLGRSQRSTLQSREFGTVEKNIGGRRFNRNTRKFAYCPSPCCSRTLRGHSSPQILKARLFVLPSPPRPPSLSLFLSEWTLAVPNPNPSSPVLVRLSRKLGLLPFSLNLGIFANKFVIFSFFLHFKDHLLYCSRIGFLGGPGCQIFYFVVVSMLGRVDWAGPKGKVGI